MGKIVISTNVSLDGVVQDPDGEEDFRLAAPSRIPSASSRHASGRLSDQSQMFRAHEVEISAAPSAARTCGCAAARQAQPICPAAQPFVTRVRWNSHIFGL